MIYRHIYKWLQKRKENRATANGIPLPSGMRKLETREYLTKKGIKNWDKLTLKDKLSLNIIID
ncbi:hypothetical protein LCGC14_1072600 [marine sediment metagenome]|uniref:Uncharacterized protein n=1 Tax=marine sediment metagenome TaxID=412755 RepID=A0A0F9Q0X1_9ZZZZ